jgi:hypothetical protein
MASCNLYSFPNLPNNRTPPLMTTRSPTATFCTGTAPCLAPAPPTRRHGRTRARSTPAAAGRRRRRGSRARRPSSRAGGTNSARSTSSARSRLRPGGGGPWQSFAGARGAEHHSVVSSRRSEAWLLCFWFCSALGRGVRCRLRGVLVAWSEGGREHARVRKTVPAVQVVPVVASAARQALPVFLVCRGQGF